MSDWYDGADAGPIDEQWNGNGFDTGGRTGGETGLETSFGETGFGETGFETGVETGGREYGFVKRWTEKGFGFIERDNGNGSLFCHARDCPDRNAGLVPGSKVSFVFEADAKSGKAKEVQIEEAAVEAAEGPREMGTIKNWNAEKGFGFIGRESGGDDVFVHKRDCDGIDFAKGQTVSFVIGEGPKGASAKKVRAEEGGTLEEVAIEEEGERYFGKVKSYNEEKGFAFISPCTGGDDLFSHKKEFSSVDPYIGQPVSYTIESTIKGDAAKKVREEASVPEPVLSDEGREFGKVKNFMVDKGFGFISWKGEEEAIVFAKELNGLTLEKNMCVSFKQEAGAKGPLAKDIRQEDPDRVARITAKVHYGIVESYFDPTEKKPTNGYGFITPLGPPVYGAPKKYYFHMSKLEDPDEDGGIEPKTGVSFIIAPARKGVQAIAVKIADPPKEEEKNENGAETSAAGGGFGDGFDDDSGVPSAGDNAGDDAGWGTFGD